MEIKIVVIGDIIYVKKTFDDLKYKDRYETLHGSKMLHDIYKLFNNSI